MRTERDNIKRNLMTFVYRLYRRKDFTKDEYANPVAECDISEAFAAYHNDVVFHQVFDVLQDSFYELFKIDTTN